jgi:hypothetical protein
MFPGLQVLSFRFRPNPTLGTDHTVENQRIPEMKDMNKFDIVLNPNLPVYLEGNSHERSLVII